VIGEELVSLIEVLRRRRENLEARRRIGDLPLEIQGGAAAAHNHVGKGGKVVLLPHHVHVGDEHLARAALFASMQGEGEIADYPRVPNPPAHHGVKPPLHQLPSLIGMRVLERAKLRH
jgi:hypothetical protein